MTATPIRPIYEMPDHPGYGPCRRLWVMLEQMFADKGGVAKLEREILLFQERLEYRRPTWYEHLVWLIDQGQSEAAAQRIVVTQMITAAEWLA